MYLLNMPVRKSKKAAYIRQYKPILDELTRLGADVEHVKAANDDALYLFKKSLSALKTKGEH